MRTKFKFIPLLILVVGLASTVPFLLNGCKTPSNAALTRPLVASAVSIGVELGIEHHADAVPYLKAATPIICDIANGTNVTPTQIVAALEVANVAALKTPEAKIIINGALSLYSAFYDQIGNSSAITNQVVLQNYLLGTCDGLNLGLSLSSPANHAVAPKERAKVK